MRVQIHPADRGGCGHYRLIWPAQALIDQGYDVVLTEEGEDSDLHAIMQRDRFGDEHIVGLAEKPDADVVVLQRPLTYQLVEMVHHLKEAGVVVVVELDDDFQNIHPRNIAWKMAHPTHNPKRNWKLLQQACQIADGVTVSTPALLHFRADAHVLPNYVPEWYTRVELGEWSDPSTIGWSGSIDTHPEDLQEVNGAVAQLVRQGHPIKIVGTGKGVHRAFGLSELTGLQASGWVGIGQYPKEMAEINVGLVPLQASKFNNAKSWLKGLEWASLGVPFVASPTAEYLRLADCYGIGKIALKAKHWPSLVNSCTADLGRQYRQSVIDNELVVEQRAFHWWNAWQEIADSSARSAA